MHRSAGDAPALFVPPSLDMAACARRLLVNGEVARVREAQEEPAQPAGVCAGPAFAGTGPDREDRERASRGGGEAGHQSGAETAQTSYGNSGTSQTSGHLKPLAQHDYLPKRRKRLTMCSKWLRFGVP